MKKRGQHYVWKHYLESWTTNGKLFCLRNNEIFETAPVNIGKKRDFYRLNELTEQDIFNIKLLISNMPVSSQKIHIGWINFFNVVFDLKKICESASVKNAEIEKELDIALNNFEEDLHSKIEGMGAPYIENIIDTNLSFFDNQEERYDFCYFLAVQYFRTNFIKKQAIETFSNFGDKVSPEFTPYILNMEKSWNILSHIFATNVGFSLSYMRLILLKNNTQIPFVTADQPAINLKATYNIKEPPEEFELYYPLSPNIAILLVDKNKDLFSENLNEDDVVKLNNAIVNASLEQIYANNRTILEQYIK